MKLGDQPPSIVWATRAGPYHNPYEVYSFSSVRFCHFIGDRDYAAIARTRSSPSLGELMAGYASWEPVASLPPVSSMASALDGVGDKTSFLQNCTTSPLTEDQAQQLSRTVERRWFYQLYLEGLPAWGMVGTEGDPVAEDPNEVQPRVFTKSFLRVTLDDLGELVKVDLVSDPASLKLIEAGVSYNFQLAIEYLRVVSSNNKGEKFDQYIDHEFFSSAIRKNSTINSLAEAIFVILLAGNVAYKLWKHTRIVSNSGDVEKGTAPLLRTDSTVHKLDPEEVFAPPSRVGLLAVLVGNGWHLLVWVFVMTLYFIDTNSLEYGPGGRLGIMVYGYAATSVVAGYTSAFYLKQQQSREGMESCKESWKITMIMTAILVPLITAIIVTIISVAAISMKNIGIMSTQVALRLLILWLCLAVPSIIVGTYLGRWNQTNCGNPISSFLALSIPPSKNLRSKWVSACIAACIGGILSLSVMLVELHYMMTSVWMYHWYKYLLVSWTDLAVLLLLVIITGSTSVVWTMMMLHTPDMSRSWQWNAFISSASTGGFLFLYSVYFFSRDLLVDGIFSTIHYFATMFLVSLGAALVCGAVAHYATCRFVEFLYSNIKAA